MRKIISKNLKADLLGLFFIFVLSMDCFAQNAVVPEGIETIMNDPTFLQEIMKQTVSNYENNMIQVMWIPYELWQATFGASITEDQLRSIEPFTIISIMSMKINVIEPSFETYDELFRKVHLKDIRGNVYEPYSEYQIPRIATTLKDYMKMNMSSIAGEMGQYMHYFFFPSRALDGTAFADAKRKGEFTVVKDGLEINWKLPLKIFMPTKVCVKCGETSKGYEFCPYCGEDFTPVKCLKCGASINRNNEYKFCPYCGSRSFK